MFFTHNKAAGRLFKALMLTAMSMLSCMPLIAQETATKAASLSTNEEWIQRITRGGNSAGGLFLNKTFEPSQGSPASGELTLESYVTGEVITSETTLPSDVVLVLDLSTSMNMYFVSQGEVSGPFSYENYTDTLLYKETMIITVPGTIPGVPPVTFESVHYYPVYREFDAASKTYRLYCLYQRDKKYLSGTDLVDTPPAITSPTEPIFTGNLWRGDTGLTSLQKATRTFIKLIAENARRYGVDHRVSIVKFSDEYYGDETSLEEGNHPGYTEVVKNFVNVNPDTNPDAVAMLIDCIYSLSPVGTTLTQNGLKKAELLLQQPYTGAFPDNRQKEVICFTDGEPSPGLLDLTISTALEIKNMGVNVWSVGAFDSEPEVNSNCWKCLHYISSDYPNAQSSTNPGAQIDNPIYSIVATNAAQLTSVFQILSTQVGHATLQLGPTSIVKDDISEYFHLPAGYDASTIRVYTADHILPDGNPNDPGYDENGYQFGTPTQQSNLNVSISPDGKTVSVSGFDFAANYVATVEGVARGKKLIVKFPVEANAGIWGDGIPTNEGSSGIYPSSGSGAVALFPIPTVNIPRITWVEFVTSMPTGWDINNIDSPEDLAWLISHVNGYNGQTAHPNAVATLTADVDMSAYNWVPIGSGVPVWNGTQFVDPDDNKFTGTFDGGFHSITGLWNQPSVVSQPGLFGTVDGGTIQNTIVAGCDFRAGQAGYFGIIADTIRNGAVVMGSEAAGLLASYLVPGPIVSSRSTTFGPNDIFLGGVVGLAEKGTEVHSCISVASLEGLSMGGVVNRLMADNGGANPAILRNSYAYPVFKNLDLAVGTYFGGFAARNAGSIENCYLRERQASGGQIGVRAMFDKIATATATDPFYKGLLVGENNGTVKVCYMPNAWSGMANSLVNVDKTGQPITVSGSVVEGTGIFTDTQTPYLYKHDDNNVSKLVPNQTNLYISSDLAWPYFLNALNAWVEGNTSRPYARWTRTTASPINSDFPVLALTGAEAVACDSVVLYYGSADDMLTHQLGTSSAADDAVFMYAKGTISVGNADKHFYIGEGVCVLQEGNNVLRNTHVGVTFDNSSVDGWDWHMFSSSLTDAPLGVVYTDNNEHLFSWTTTEVEYAFSDEIDGFFPAKEYGTNANYYTHWDYYCYDENSYHWINFKRNSNSHWHQDIIPGGDMNNPAHHPKITYENETTLTSGKGYMMAIDAPTFMQAGGTLQNGTVTRAVTNSAVINPGYNLIGNPYQSILNYEAFAGQNAAVLGASPSYTIFDADQGGYVSYLPGTSKGAKAASRSISPLQGFFVYAPADGNVTFDNTMRKLEPASGDNYGGFRGGETERPTYPLVNITMTDDEGKNEILVVEFGRPENGGAKKMMAIRNGKGKLYARHEGDNMSIAFAKEGIEAMPVRFETDEDAVFTMHCEPANGPFRYLHLIDNITGIDHDLLSENTFTFEGKASDYTSRFRLVVAVDAVEEITSGSIADQFAYFDGGTWIVEAKGDMEVYDITGRLMLSKHLANAQNSIDLSGLAGGVYLMRVSNGTDAKMQKIVVE